jgi:AmmeMemoRadiSam system protein B
LGAGLLALLLVAVSPAGSSAQETIPSLYADAQTFDAGIAAAAKLQVPAPGDITGLVVPHHLVAADLIALAFRLVQGQPISTVIILTPDHFRRAHKPFATTERDFDTVYGTVRTRRSAVAELLKASDLVEESKLFDQEHGVAALLPFLHRALPDAEIVPVAVALTSRRADWDQMVALLTPLVGAGTLIVQSTDFSHYLSFPDAIAHDQRTLAVVATGDLDAIASLRQPQQVDSVGANYLQVRLQRDVFGASPVVLFNRNMQQYEPRPVSSTTSYMVQVFSRRWSGQIAPEAPGSRRLCFMGDTFFGRGIAAALADPRAADRLAGRLDALLDGCRLLVNLEGVVVADLPAALPAVKLAMPRALTLDWLHRLGVVAVSLANNHAHDLGPDAYDAMRQTLHEAGIQVVGDGEVIDVCGVHVLALTDLDNTGTPSKARLDGDRIRGLASAVRRPPLFAFLHWGKEFHDTIGPREVRLSAELLDGGVNAIIGAHPHVAIPRIDLVEGSFVPRAYSLGNFIFDQTARLASGAAVELRVFDQGSFALRLVPLPNVSDILTSTSPPP